jgi:cyclophilin family peptidyl-prolyl cis-trans isomerase
MSTTSRSPRILVLLLIVLVALFATACGSDSSDDSDTGKEETSDASGGGESEDSGDIDAKVAERADSYDSPPGKPLDADKEYVVELDTTEGPINITIDQKAGPLAAANFVALVEDGFYDGIRFHRVIDGFMVQAGDPLGTGTGGPGYTIKDDPVVGDYEPGIVAMANAGPDTGGSQFFIVQGEAVQLPPDYVIFGRTDAEGIETVNKIAAVEVDGEAPVEPVRINSAKLR